MTTLMPVKRMEYCPGSLRKGLNPTTMVACLECPDKLLTTPSGILPWHKRDRSEALLRKAKEA